MKLNTWIEARLAALPEDAFDSLDDWPENEETFDPSLPGSFEAQLEPITVDVEYRDASGEITERRITLIRMRGNSEGAIHLICRCHHRKACRTFRFDRMLNISGLPGLPADATPADALLAIAASAIDIRYEGDEPLIASKARAKPDTSFATVRKSYRDEIRLLAFLSKSDGVMHPAEEEAIDAYCQSRAAEMCLIWTHQDTRALTTYMRNMAFSADVERQCLDRLDRSSRLYNDAFKAAISAVVEADGEVSAGEVTMLAEWGLAPKLETTDAVSEPIRGKSEVTPRAQIKKADKDPTTSLLTIFLLACVAVVIGVILAVLFPR